jgi:hypothetical protein
MRTNRAKIALLKKSYLLIYSLGCQCRANMYCAVQWQTLSISLLPRQTTHR